MTMAAILDTTVLSISSSVPSGCVHQNNSANDVAE